MNIQITYDDKGRPTGARYDGEEKKLSPQERASLPPDFSNGANLYDLTSQVRSTTKDMKDSFDRREGSIIARMEATHGGYFNLNHYNYLVSGMRESVETWTEPYGNPYLTNHDRESDPLGRVQSAVFVDTGPNTGMHQLDVKVTDEDEIERILSDRSLTVSVGSQPVDSVTCSNCDHDLYHDGPHGIRYELDAAPSEEWLEADAPGLAGLFGLTNRDFWDIQEDDGTWTAECGHQRGMDAPQGGEDFEPVGWYLSKQRYGEVSRVNFPADQNRETGEHAHISEVLSGNAAERQADGLEGQMRQDVLVGLFSQAAPNSLVDRSRFSVAREEDLWKPSSLEDLQSFYADAGPDGLFERGLWIACDASSNSREEALEKYMARGGRLVGDAPDTTWTPAEALTKSPNEFGDWLRQSDYSREEARALEALHFQKYIKKEI